MAGTSNYPGSLDDFSTTSPPNLGDTDSTGRSHSKRHDDLEAAVEAVQGELGVNPSGPSASTVAARLTGIEADYLTASAASTIYLTQTDASAVYLTQVDASATYITPGDVSASFLPLSLATSAGEIIVAESSGSFVSLSVGSNNQYLRVNASATGAGKIEWADIVIPESSEPLSPFMLMGG